MEQKSIILNFPKETIDQPIISRVIKNFNIDINILQARINPEEEGHMFAIIKGNKKDITRSLDYISQSGVKFRIPEDNLIRDEDKCTHCGACVAHCIPEALTIDNKTYKVLFDSEKCIGCELCISVCSYNAVESFSEQLKRKEVR